MDSSGDVKFGLGVLSVIIITLALLVQFDYRQIRDLQRRVGQLESERR